MRISAKKLESLGACSEQIALFQKHYGEESVLITERECLKHASEFDWDWAATHLLTAPARKAYYKACMPAPEAYNKAFATAWEAYCKARASAQEAYNKACMPAREAYNKARASAFASALCWEEKQVDK